MFKIKKEIYFVFHKIILIMLSVLLSSHAFAKVCLDDPRMFTIKTVLEQAENGMEYKPMKLTPTTFLMLTPPTRKALGDNIVVYNDQCIPQQIFKGQLPRKIQLPYEDLSYALHMSLIQNDLETANIIFNSFVSAPKTPSELITMIRSLAWHSNAVEHLYSQGMLEKRGMEYWGSLESNRKLCNSTVSLVTHLELFAALGGKANKTDLIVSRYNNNSMRFYARHSEIRTRSERDRTDELNCSAFNSRRLQSNLTTAGLEVQGYSSPKEQFKVYDNAKNPPSSEEL